MNHFLLRLVAVTCLMWGATTLFAQPAGQKKPDTTPSQTEGPFYPDKLPADTDNDLLIINDAKKMAKGTVTHLHGRILDAKGQPVPHAVVEIWQSDSAGVYNHSKSPNRAKQDPNFQGFGRSITNADGEYYFRTIKPVPYLIRTPHIHFAVYKDGKRFLTTQMYVKGEALNNTDFILQQMRDAKARESLIVEFTPAKGTKGEMEARFDIRIGTTPEVIDND
jgi:protocatechuate 3,4-dioxygenase beta subunit